MIKNEITDALKNLVYAIIRIMLFIHVIIVLLLVALQRAYSPDIIIKKTTLSVDEVSCYLYQTELENLGYTATEIDTFLNSQEIKTLLGKIEAERFKVILFQAKAPNLTDKAVIDEMSRILPTYIKKTKNEDTIGLCEYLYDVTGFQQLLEETKNATFTRNYYNSMLSITLTDSEFSMIKTVIGTLFSTRTTYGYLLSLFILSLLMIRLQKESTRRYEYLAKTFLTPTVSMTALFVHYAFVQTHNYQLTQTARYCLGICATIIIASFLLWYTIGPRIVQKKLKKTIKNNLQESKKPDLT